MAPDGWAAARPAHGSAAWERRHWEEALPRGGRSPERLRKRSARGAGRKVAYRYYAARRASLDRKSTRLLFRSGTAALGGGTTQGRTKSRAIAEAVSTRSRTQGRIPLLCREAGEPFTELRTRHYAAATDLGRTARSMSFCFACRATRKSYSSWRPSQDSAEVPR